jgi:hypothetical protein
MPDTFLNEKPLQIPQWIAVKRIGSAIPGIERKADESM